MRLLALDVAKITGWAYWEGTHTRGELIRSGFTVLPLRRGDSRGILFLKFEGWLRGVLNDARPHAIAYEEPTFFRSQAAGEVIHGLLAIVVKMAARRKIEVMSVHLSTLKKHATGDGHAPKPMMQRAAAHRWGVIVKDDNHGDALCVMDWALTELGLWRPTPRGVLSAFTIRRRGKRGQP